MVECYTIIITFSLYDSRPVCHPSINPSRLQQHLLMPHRLSDKPIVTHHKFYQTVAILQTHFPLLALFPCLQVRKKNISLVISIPIVLWLNYTFFL